MAMNDIIQSIVFGIVVVFNVYAFISHLCNSLAEYKVIEPKETSRIEQQ